MDSSLLDQNTVSIIRSPNKQFYFMAALDSNDFEQFCVTREFRVHDDNVSGHHSTDNMVNGWHRHANEQVSIDNATGMTYNKLNEEKPNKGMNSLSCDAMSSEFLAINMQKSFDISNTYSANLAIAQNDSFPGLPATTSSTAAVLQVDRIEHNRIASIEGISRSEAHSKNKVVNAVSLAKLCDPSDAHHGIERGCCNPPSSGHGCYNPPSGSGQVKVKRSPPRKSAKKSKSFYNNCNNSRKNYCGQRLSSDTDTSSNENNVRIKSEIRIENDVLSNAFSVQPCSSSSSSSSSGSSQLSSHRRLSNYVVRSTGESSRSENSYGNGDSEACGKYEEDAVTSGFTSAGDHESTAIDQTWDGYQVPLYAAISDDSTEEKLDASNLLQAEWQPLTDEFMDFTDFGNNSASHGQHDESEVDSDTDVEELIHLISESSDALRLTKLSLNELKKNNGSRQSSLHREPLATCSTNINCLRNLLDIVSQNEWTHAEVNQLSDLLKQWQDVESEFLHLTFRKDVSISHSDVSIDVSQFNALPVSPASQKTSNNSSDFDVTMIESPSSPSCYFECCNKSFSNRFDVFNYNVSKLLKGSGPLHEATLAPIQFVLFIILLLIFFYLIAFNYHYTGIVGIKFDPQLRYVLGPPPL